MGALGYTLFCENGHIVDVVGHNEMSKYDESCFYCPVHSCGPIFDSDGDGDVCTCKKRPPCACGSTNFRNECEWGDERYEPHDGFLVPYEPIAEDEVVSDTIATVVTMEGRVMGKLVVTVSKYDVDALFEEIDY